MPSSLHLVSILSIDFILLFIRIFANPMEQSFVSKYHRRCVVYLRGVFVDF